MVDMEGTIESYLGVSDATNKNIIVQLMSGAMLEATDYCNLLTYDIKLDSTVVKMVIQQYNKLKTEGISSQSYSGVSETFIDGYSKDVMDMLNRFRKVRFL
jgi:hypothetical protein